MLLNCERALTSHKDLVKKQILNEWLWVGACESAHQADAANTTVSETTSSSTIYFTSYRKKSVSN